MKGLKEYQTISECVADIVTTCIKMLDLKDTQNNKVMVDVIKYKLQYVLNITYTLSTERNKALEALDEISHITEKFKGE